MAAQISAQDLERMQFFERAKEEAEKDYQKNKRDAVALTRWGGALMELANYKSSEEALSMIDEAVGKFEEALKIDEKKPDALWCLGNALTSQGFLMSTEAEAATLFKKAKTCFQKAVALDPHNEMFKKALEMCIKAPELYKEIQRSVIPSEGLSKAKSSWGKSKIGDFWWDLAGYAILAGLLTALFYLSKNATPTTPGAAAPAPAGK